MVKQYRVAALPGSFMMSSILGFLISAIWVWPTSQSFGFAFMTVFVIMFIASIISMTYGSADEALKYE